MALGYGLPPCNNNSTCWAEGVQKLSDVIVPDDARQLASWTLDRLRRMEGNF